METIRIDEIIVPDNRQRRTFSDEALAELRESVSRTGLLHAIILRNDGRTLVAGERRLRALKDLTRPYYYHQTEIPAGYIPFTRLRDLTPLQLEEAELEENIIRVDLPWQEKDRALARLHRLRTEQASERGEVQTKVKTVAELIAHGVSGVTHPARISDAILVADHLDDPTVAGAKSRKEALNIIKHKVQREFNATLAESWEQQVADGAARFDFRHGDCRELLPTIRDNSVDVILTDPPYNIRADKMRPMSGSQSGLRHDYDDSSETIVEIWQSIFRQGFRVAKHEAHLYMFCDFKWWMTLYAMANNAGWTSWPRPIIWDKSGGGMLGDSEHGPRMTYECILYARKGNRKVTAVYPDVVRFPSAAEHHAAEKPVEVLKNLLVRSVRPGDVVLDPCAGSGSTIFAADELNCFCIAFEKEKIHYDTALARIYGVTEKETT